jgi:tetratricopeptide (TPR) repeat protein
LSLHDKLEKKIQNVVFIELKKEYQLKELKLPAGTSLPIKLDYLLNELEEENAIDKIEAANIIDSIIYLLGIDKDFIYKKKYLEILLELKLDIKNYVLYKAYENENKDLTDAYIYLNAYKNIVGDDEDILFKEGNILEAIYNDNLEERTGEENKKLLEDIIKKYNEVLNLNDKYDLAYYRLAYINLNLNRFIKSKLYFEKFINFTKDEELKDEARSKLEILKNYAAFDSAKAFIARGDFTKAKIEMDKIDDNFQKDMSFYYLMGLCEYNLGRLDEAYENINKSIEHEANEENINLLAMILLNKEEYNQAIEVYKDGIEKLENSFVLNYNLGLILLDLNEVEEALEYLERAQEISPNKELKDFIKKLK